MATYYLPSNTGSYSTSNDKVKYRIVIVENGFNSSTRKLNITVKAYFWRTNTGYTTDYAHTLKYTVNGTARSYTNAYGAYPITNSGVYLNSYTVDVPVNDDGSVSITVYCQYTSTNSSNLTTDNNGGSISLTKQTAKTYAVSFNANGGSGAPTNQTKYHGTTLKLSSVVPTRTGYTFVGWSTSNTATSASYYAGGNYTANEGATLYAVWSAIIYKVTYNGNSGTSEVHGEAMSDTATYGQDYETKGNMFEKLGYEFIGWNEKADGTGTDWTDKIGTPFAWNYTNNIVLYAQWEIKANCRVKQEGQHKLGMIYVKNSGQYYPCIVSKKVDGTYKNSTIT